MVLTNRPASPALTEQIWVTIQEACAIFGKFPRSVQYAIWQDNVKARQARVGKTWLLELNSCISFWGQPINTELVKEIKSDVYTD